jgi:tRNA nucleotidyltransferase/poly(A) polymerase
MAPLADQRAFALAIAEKLRAAGFEALWAGGCVRDQLLGLTPKDYDVATNATPNQIRDLFGRRRTLPIGAAFGVVTVLGPRAVGQIEVATFRADAAYSDGRRPDSVTFTTAEHDAQRRDFTINGLFFDPVEQVIVDYVNGQEDLKHGIVRAIGDPDLRIGEDKLRMLRAVRFAATFGFTIEPATRAAIERRAGEITAVSAERIGMEIRRMLIDQNRDVAVRLLLETKLLSQVLPELAAVCSADFDEMLRILGALDEPTLPLALAALLSVVAIVPGANVDPSPQVRGKQSVAQIVGRRLRFANKETERAAWLLASRPLLAAAPQLPWPQLQRILIHDGVQELLALQQAIAGPDDAALAFCRERLAWPSERLNPPPLVDGAELVRHGLKPGPQFSQLLDQIRDAQINGEIQSRAEALALVDRLRATRDSLP